MFLLNTTGFIQLIPHGMIITIIDEIYILQIASRPGSRHFRCLFRVAYVPKDSYDLLKQDPIAFEYFYTQVWFYFHNECTSVVYKNAGFLTGSVLHIQLKLQ